LESTPGLSIQSTLDNLSFALQSMEAARPQQSLFFTERKPRNKQGVSHFGHRVAMLWRALQPYKQFEVLELGGYQFSVCSVPCRNCSSSLRIANWYSCSDQILSPKLPGWPHSGQLLAAGELVVGIRKQDDEAKLRAGPGRLDRTAQSLNFISQLRA